MWLAKVKKFSHHVVFLLQKVPRVTQRGLTDQPLCDVIIMRQPHKKSFLTSHLFRYSRIFDLAFLFAKG